MSATDEPVGTGVVGADGKEEDVTERPAGKFGFGDANSRLSSSPFPPRLCVGAGGVQADLEAIFGDDSSDSEDDVVTGRNRRGAASSAAGAEGGSTSPVVGLC
jgi:hypothetical protein